MIVESQAEPITSEGRGVALYRSLDELLRYWALKRPDAPALSGSAVDGGAQSDFTFAAAEIAVARLSALFLAQGLRSGDVVAVQLPNTPELVLAVLAAMRAGLTVSPVPLVWRKNELLRAFDRAPPRAVVTCGLFRGVDYAAVMLRATQAQAEKTGDAQPLLFGFGAGLPSGVLGLDGSLRGHPGELVVPAVAALQPAVREGPGLLSWGFDREFGPVAIPRTSREIVAAGLSPALELQLSDSDRIINPYSLSSLVGLAGAVAPWLITGASLLLHTPYDHEAFMEQIRTQAVTVAVAPAPVLADLAGREAFVAGCDVLSRVLWVLPAPHSPAPERRPFPGVAMVIARNLREYALVARRWTDNGGAWAGGAIAFGAAAPTAPGSGGAPLLETRVHSKSSRGHDAGAGVERTGSGELCVRGPAAPGAGCPSAARRLRCDGDGFIHTGIPCAPDGDLGDALVCLPEPDIAYHGGVLIDIQELDRIYGDFPDFLDVAAFTIADPIMGERVFAAVVPLPGAAPPEAEFRDYLQSLDISPVKFPEKLIVVSVIPRDGQGRAVRGEILSQL